MTREATCSRCRRPYFEEPANDNGRCCICNRDARMVREVGPDWRAQIREKRVRVTGTDLAGRVMSEYEADMLGVPPAYREPA